MRYLSSVPGCKWYLRQSQLAFCSVLSVGMNYRGTWLVAGNVLGL